MSPNRYKHDDDDEKSSAVESLLPLIARPLHRLRTSVRTIPHFTVVLFLIVALLIIVIVVGYSWIGIIDDPSVKSYVPPPTSSVISRRTYGRVTAHVNTSVSSFPSSCDMAFACLTNAALCSVSAAMVIACFFDDIRLTHPSVLTNRPVIDCLGGRYLYLQTAFNDGLGSQFAYYNTILHIAAVYNLTLVHARPPLISHSGDTESNDADVFEWKRWHVDKDEYLSCPMSSAVRTHFIDMAAYGFVATQIESKRTVVEEFDSHTKQSRLSSAVRKSMESALATVSVSDGLTIAIPDVHPWITSFQNTSLIHAVRWAATSPSYRHDHADAIQCHRYNPQCLTFVIHVRRGDIVEEINGEVYFKDFSYFRPRIVTSAAIHQLIQQANRALPLSIQRTIHWSIITEGNSSTHVQSIVDELVETAASVTVYLNGASSDVIHIMADADVIFVAPSFLSFTAGVINPFAIKIGSPQLQFNRFHGMRRFIPAPLIRTSQTYAWDTESFHLTAEKDIEQTWLLSKSSLDQLIHYILESVEHRRRGQQLMEEQSNAWRRVEGKRSFPERLQRQRTFVRQIIAAATETDNLFGY